MVDWHAVRAEFPSLATWTFLNTATYGQLPRRAVAAVTEHFLRRDREACNDFLAWFDDADHIRASVARLVNASAEDIAFVPNASTALGWLLTGLDWKGGDRVVTLHGEFPNNLYAPARLRDRGVEFVETDWDGLQHAVDAGRTRLVLVSTINYTTGFVAPLAGLSSWLRDRGALLYVDGTQSVGALRFDCRDLQPDLLAVHGYKWLLSPNGAGFAYVSPSLREWLPPSVVGWRSDRDWRQVDHLHHGEPRLSRAAERYEGGMLNFPSLYAMGASVDMFLELGSDVVEARVLELSRKCEEVLEEAGGQILHRGSPVLAARFRDRDPSDLARVLRERRIQVSARHGALRVSVHIYNDESDLERLREGLAAALHQRAIEKSQI